MLESDSSSIYVWVAESRNEIVGFCSVGPSSDDDETFELAMIYLLPGRERQGIGGALLHLAECEMVKLGVRSAVLWVLEENHGARHFYETSGWSPDGVEKSVELWGATIHELRYSKLLVADKG